MLGFDIQIYRVEDKETLVFHYENLDVQWLDELVKENKAQTWPSNGYPIKFEVSVKDSIDKLNQIKPNARQTVLSDTKLPDINFSKKDDLIHVLKKLNGDQILYIEAWDLS
jgi:hypothetical protein